MKMYLLKIPPKSTRYTRNDGDPTLGAAASLRLDTRRRASFIRVEACKEIYRRTVNSREQEL